MSMVISELDLGTGNIEADTSTQIGSPSMPDTGGVISKPDPAQADGYQYNGEAAAPAPEGQPSTAGTEPKTAQVADAEGNNWETAPEHFRNSYQKRLSELEQERTEKETYKTELESLRTKQGQSAYLNTDVPFEDFDPYEGLQRMATEEPDYHDAVVDAVLQAHLWPNLADEVSKLEGKTLGRLENGMAVFDDEMERVQYQQIQRVWDFLANRVAGVNGTTLTSLINIVAGDPEIQHLIEAKLSGGPPTPYTPQQAGAGAGPQRTDGEAPGVQTLRDIAKEQGYDLSDPDHMRQAQAFQGLQRRAATTQAQFQSALASRDAQMAQMKSALEQVQGGQKQAQTVSAADAERQAESRVAEYMRTAIETEYTEKYVQAIPKDRPELGERLKTLVKEKLNADPNFQTARSGAMKWLKQAATASADQRVRYEQKGLDALGVIATLRSRAMADEAKILLGRLPAQVAGARQQTAAARSKRELPGGSTASQVPPQAPPTIAPGDIEATRRNVRERMKQAGIRIG